MQYIAARQPFRDAATVLIADISLPAARVAAAVCHLAGYSTIICRPDELGAELPRGCRADIEIIGVIEAIEPRSTRRLAAVVPAILITGSLRDLARVEELKYDAVLLRPVTPSQLREVVRKLLAEARSRQPARRLAAADVDAEQRTLMQEIQREEYAALRARSQRLRGDAVRLCRYARGLRRRARGLNQIAAPRHGGHSEPSSSD